jgi:hypothetical protein
VLIFIIQLANGDQVKLPRPSASNGRTPIPPLKVARCGRIRHFGGSLQVDHTFPKNYVAFTLQIGKKLSSSLISRLIVRYLERSGPHDDVLDATFVLAGETIDELPERALATRRSVRLDGPMIASPVDDVSNKKKENITHSHPTSSLSQRVMQTYGFCFRVLVTDPAIAVFTYLFSSDEASAASGHSPRLGTRLKKRMGALAGHIKHEQMLSSDHLLEQMVIQVEQILQDITVPASPIHPFHPPGNSGSRALCGVDVHESENLVHRSVLSIIDREEIRRFVLSSNMDMKVAALRLVQSAAWRGLTFPIDTQSCRIELHNGQFFQQGHDLEGNPVFYFRNMLLGRWRRNEHALISAVLYRLDQSIRKLQESHLDVKFTLIVMMGKPYTQRERRQELSASDSASTRTASIEDEDVEVAEEMIENEDDDDGMHEHDIKDETGKNASDSRLHNPRIGTDEKWYVHTNGSTIRRLIHLVMAHFPERLRRALVVVGKGNTTYFRTAVGGSIRLAAVPMSSKTSQKVKFLIRYVDLRQYAKKEDLSVLVGGTLLPSPSSFQ